jgi:hypothetical protein
MEYDTLTELVEKLPFFASQLNVDTRVLVRVLNATWLPYIRVVQLPESVRHLDPRAEAVRALDPDDYPAAALATLLSPCILLTHNFKDFAPLGTTSWRQGTDAVKAVVAVRDTELQAQVSTALPASPAIIVGAGLRAAAQKLGPIVWVFAALAAAGGTYLYKQQPSEKRAAARKRVGEIFDGLLEEMQLANAEAHAVKRLLVQNVVPPSADTAPIAAVARLLALTDAGLSAQQLCDLVGDELRPSVTTLRQYLHANKPDTFYESRQGGFVLGRRLAIRGD